MSIVTENSRYIWERIDTKKLWHCALILVLAIVLYKEFSTSLFESSRGAIRDMASIGSLVGNYKVFGTALDVILSFFLSLGNLLSISEAESIDLFCHVIFIFSGFFWAFLLYIGRRQSTFPASFILIALFLNPAFLNLDTFAWRQSLALAVLFLGVYCWQSHSRYAGAVLQLISAVIHPGLAPFLGLFWMLTFMTVKIRFFFVIIIVFIVTPILYLCYPFQVVLPEWFPFRYQITLPRNFALSAQEFNNINGSFVLKYYAIAILPVFISAVPFFFRERMGRAVENILISSVLPMVALNFMPGANRLVFSVFAAFAVFAPEYILRFSGHFNFTKHNASIVAVGALGLIHLAFFLAL